MNVKKLTTLAMLTAIEIVLSRFLSINAWNIKIGFSFVPIVVAAILYGPIAAGIVVYLVRRRKKSAGRRAAAAAACAACGAPLEPGETVCPYCGTGAGQGPDPSVHQ